MTRKDLNYIASVEKAVAEKYGKKAVQDFRSTWDAEDEKRYLVQLKKLNEKSTKSKYRRPETDRTCPVCKTYSFSNQDDLYMNRYSCCFACYLDFIEGRESRWQSGWLPHKEDIETFLRRRK